MKCLDCGGDNLEVEIVNISKWTTMKVIICQDCGFSFDQEWAEEIEDE